MSDRKPIAERFYERISPEPMSGCWLWLAGMAGEYGVLTHEGVTFAAHRLAWEIHKGPVPDGLWLLHKCDVKTCVNPLHLFLGDWRDNVDDMIMKGRNVKGSEVGNSKLNSATVRRIRSLYSEGVPIVELLARFGTSYQNIWYIVKSDTWRSIN